MHFHTILGDVVDPGLLFKCLLENVVPEIDHLNIGKLYLLVFKNHIDFLPIFIYNLPC